MEEMKESTGFVGLGNMGQPMARNLLKAGYRLRVYTRDARKPTRCATSGLLTPQWIPHERPILEPGSL